MSPAERIAAAAAEDRCPECWSVLDSERVGSGRFSDGVFCSLTCLSRFHSQYFEGRIKGSVPSEN